MARILDQETQRRALKNINDTIREIKTTNEFLDASNPSGVYTLSFAGDDGKKISATIHLDSKDDLDMLIVSHKTQEKQRLEKLAAENRIELDEDDIEVLSYKL